MMEYKSKILEIERLIKPILHRLKEYHDRPIFITKIENYLINATIKLNKIRELKPYINETDLSYVSDVITNTTEWLKNITEYQNEIKPSEEPILLVKDIKHKMNYVKELIRMVNSIPKPKIKPVVKEENNETSSEYNSTNVEENNSTIVEENNKTTEETSTEEVEETPQDQEKTEEEL